jgi:hypothetical protein
MASIDQNGRSSESEGGEVAKWKSLRNLGLAACYER